MSYDNRVSELISLDDTILVEVVREGEAMLAAQLNIATAADQRALTFAGFLIAISTAVLGGAAALVLGEKTNWCLVVIGAGYAAWLIAAAGGAIWSAMPNMFSVPGNEPSSWHPEQWRVGSAGPFSIKQARVEQAVTLQSQIGKNKRALKRNAGHMTRAIGGAFVATVLAASALGVWGSEKFHETLVSNPPPVEGRRHQLRDARKNSLPQSLEAGAVDAKIKGGIKLRVE